MHTSLVSNDRGFSLIELLIVVAIIGIIAAIAIPNLSRSRDAANAASAAQSMRLIHTSQASYFNSNGEYTDLASLGNAGLIADSSLSAGQKSGYQFVLTLPVPAATYVAVASPVVSSGNLYYFIDTTGVMRFEVGTSPTVASQPVD